MEVNRNLIGLYDFLTSLETPVEIVRPPIDVFEPPGSDVVYEVELNKDRVEVKWLRNNMTIVQGDKYQMMSEGKIHRLQVCEIRPRDQGEYRVIAKDKDARAKLELAGKMNVIYLMCNEKMKYFTNKAQSNVIPLQCLGVSPQLCQQLKPWIKSWLQMLENHLLWGFPTMLTHKLKLSGSTMTSVFQKTMFTLLSTGQNIG